MAEERMILDIKVAGPPSPIFRIIWRIAFAAFGVSLAVSWLLTHLYSRASETNDALGFIWARVADMTLEYLQFLILLILNVLLTPRLDAFDAAYSTAVMMALVVSCMLAGSAIARALRLFPAKPPL
jgi:hypothetical protein